MPFFREGVVCIFARQALIKPYLARYLTINKIRNVDKRWNQTKSGDLGPAAQFYATIPKGVIGLGAGSFGETGRGIQEYHALIANHAPLTKSKSF